MSMPKLHVGYFEIPEKQKNKKKKRWESFTEKSERTFDILCTRKEHENIPRV